jgi:C1A family cysteine protease
MIKFNRTLSLLLLLVFSSTIYIDHSDELIQRKIIHSFINGPKKELFKVFHFLYEKEYQLNSEEGIRRYRIFKDNLKLIKEVNEQNLSYTLGITPFADLTHEEFVNTYTTPFPDIHKTSMRQNLKLEAPPKKIDWSMHMSPVMNQGTCGTCWAFAITSGIIGNYNKLFNISNEKEKFNLSNQDLIDCTFPSSPQSCNEVFTYLHLKK